MELKNRLLLIGLLWSLATGALQAQTQHHPYYDIEKKVHFGFTLGTNFSDLKYSFKSNFYTNDTLNYLNIKTTPGITLGAICNFHLHENLDLRLIPSLLLSQRNVDFTFSNGLFKTKTVESVYADIPVLLKYKSARHGNVRFYVLGGAEYAYDIAAKQGDQKDYFDPNIAFRHNNFFYDWGFGFDFYFPYFKFSPEIKIANGINNVLDPDKTVYSDSFSKIRNRMILLSFHFE